MRVWRTLPQFTFILSERFVNHISSVSTGFFRFFPVLFAFGHFLSEKTKKKPRNSLLKALASRPIFRASCAANGVPHALATRISVSKTRSKSFGVPLRVRASLPGNLKILFPRDFHIRLAPPASIH